MNDSSTTCAEALSRLEAAVSVMATNTDIAAAAVITANAHIAAGHAALRDAVERLETVRSVDPTVATSNVSQDKQIIATADGSGAGSPEVFQEITKRNWHGRLGRTHMVDVDHMHDSARKELDCYLRRTIGTMFPVDGGYRQITPDPVFATLSAFGLRLEERGPMADVSIFLDADHQKAPTMKRMQNFGAHYLINAGENFSNYWRGSAMETLIELARYRGLFGEDGFLKVVN